MKVRSEKLLTQTKKGVARKFGVPKTSVEEMGPVNWSRKVGTQHPKESVRPLLFLWLLIPSILFYLYHSISGSSSPMWKVEYGLWKIDIIVHIFWALNHVVVSNLYIYHALSQLLLARSYRRKNYWPSWEVGQITQSVG